MTGSGDLASWQAVSPAHAATTKAMQSRVPSNAWTDASYSARVRRRMRAGSESDDAEAPPSPGIDPPAAGEPPHNPNGSVDDIAGICDASGLVLGLIGFLWIRKIVNIEI